MVKMSAPGEIEEKYHTEALHFAAYYSKVTIVKMLLERGASVNALDEDRKTPLHYAIEGIDDTGELKNYPEVIDILLNHGANVNCESDFGVSPLLNAVKIGNQEIVQKLLADSSNPANTQDSQEVLAHSSKPANSQERGKRSGYTPLHLAVEINRQDMVDFMLNSGADVNIVAKEYGTALHIAVANHRFQIAEVLLDRGACTNTWSTPGKQEGYTPLHATVFASQSPVGTEHELKILNKLFERGANVNAVSGDGRTPLHMAVERNCAKVAEVLLKRGADANALTRLNKTALCLAVERGCLEIVRLIFKHCPDLDQKEHRGILRLAVEGECFVQPGMVQEVLNYGFSVFDEQEYSDLFHDAVKKNCVAMLQHLLEQGFDVNKRQTLDNGTTFMPLHFAVERDALREAEMLIEHGADVNAKNHAGQTPLSCLKVVRKNGIDYPSYLMLELLLRKQANTRSNPELLISAVENYNLDLIHLLREHNVDINGEDNHGFTPLHHAVFGNRSRPRADLVRLLLNYGANVNAKYKSNISVLHAAALLDLRYQEILEILLEHGADVTSDCEGITPLHLAALRGNAPFCQLLLEKGAQVNAKSRNAGRTALHVFVSEQASSVDFDKFVELFLRVNRVYILLDDYASKFDSTISTDWGDVINTLVYGGADVNAKDNHGRTPLHYAGGNNRAGSTLIRALILRGAFLTSRDIFSRTAVHYAAEASFFNVKELLSWGADVNSKDINGLTPLHSAAKNGLKMILALIYLGCDIRDVNKDKVTPIEEAVLAELHTLISEVTWKTEATMSDFQSRCENLLRVLSPIKNHVIKVRAAYSLLHSGEPLSFDSLPPAAAYEECKREITAMKFEKVGDFPFSYYDLFTSSRNQLVRLAKNDTLVELLEDVNFVEKFPHYSYEFELRIQSLKQASVRALLLDTGTEVFRTCIYDLPDLCLDVVLDFLSDDDLENLARAYDPNTVIVRKQVELPGDSILCDDLLAAADFDDSDESMYTDESPYTDEDEE